MEPAADGAMSTKDIKTVTARFYMNYEADRNAWEKLKALSRRYHLNFNQVIIMALNAADTEHFPSNGQADAQMLQQLSLQVAELLKQNVPAEPAQKSKTGPLSEPLTAAPVVDDPSPDFSNSRVDWSFIG